MARVWAGAVDVPCPCAWAAGAVPESAALTIRAMMSGIWTIMSLLPSWDARHVGKFVGDTLVAVDAGFLAGEQEALVRGCGARVLLHEVHGFRAVAVAAFERVVGLHPLPLTLGEVLAHGQELVARVDGPEDMTPDLLRSLHLAGDLVGPLV